MAKCVVINHPLIQHKLTIIRDKNTSTKAFREVTNEISMLMAYEITRDLPVEDVVIETPLVETNGTEHIQNLIETFEQKGYEIIKIKSKLN